MTRILIAEDEPGIVSFVERGLKANGYSVVAVGNGIDAAAIARDDSFELMILDLGLPGMDGRDVLRTVRARGERLPIVVLSARDGVEDTVGSLEQGRRRLCHQAVPLRRAPGPNPAPPARRRSIGDDDDDPRRGVAGSARPAGVGR